MTDSRPQGITNDPPEEMFDDDTSAPTAGGVIRSTSASDGVAVSNAKMNGNTLSLDLDLPLEPDLPLNTARGSTTRRTSRGHRRSSNRLAAATAQAPAATPTQNDGEADNTDWSALENEPPKIKPTLKPSAAPASTPATAPEDAAALGQDTDERPYAPTAPLQPDAAGPAIAPADREQTANDTVDIGRAAPTRDTTGGGANTPAQLPPGAQQGAAASVAQSKRAKARQSSGYQIRRPGTIESAFMSIKNRKEISKLQKDKKTKSSEDKLLQAQILSTDTKILMQELRAAVEFVTGVGAPVAAVQTVRLVQTLRKRKKLKENRKKVGKEIAALDEQISNLRRLQQNPKSTAPGKRAAA